MNERIRMTARKKRVALWEIAEKIGISEATITRWMRTLLPEEKENRILQAITKIAEERKAD